MGKKSSKNKAERIKFLEGVVYAILIIVTIVATSYGSIYIKLIPLLFLLGIIGKVIYERPVITTLFGTTFSIIVMYVNGTYSVNEILISSVTNGILIALGEVFGICSITCIGYIKKKKLSKVAIKNYTISVLFFVLSVFVTLYLNGNLIDYKKAETNLKKYLRDEYDGLTFEVFGYRYIPFNKKGYSFKVKNVENNNIYRFIVYSDKSGSIYDEFGINVLMKKNSDIKKYITNTIKEENYSIDATYYEYNKCNVSIVYKTDESSFELYEQKLIDYAIEVLNKIKLYKNVEEIVELQVIARDSTGKNIYVNSIDIKDYIEKTTKQDEKEYIKNNLEIEFFDF